MVRLTEMATSPNNDALRNAMIALINAIEAEKERVEAKIDKLCKSRIQHTRSKGSCTADQNSGTGGTQFRDL